MSNNQSIICFGEMLWDLLPSGKVEGGAPMNVACHAARLGHPTRMISRVGDDDLGRCLIKFLVSKQVNSQSVQIDPTVGTGTVKVMLDEFGTPSYDIVFPSAWDFISIKPEDFQHVRSAAAFVFGSLITRQAESYITLLRYLEVAAFRVFDVNLRAPFYSEETIDVLLKAADMVKMNEQELQIIAGWNGFEGTVEEQMEALFGLHNWKVLIVTLGSNGAYAHTRNGICYERGLEVDVKDTVGSGDAFLAGFLHAYLEQRPIKSALRYANVLGAFNATFTGGTPMVEEGAFEAFCQNNNLIID
jgi:fructokinase